MKRTTNNRKDTNTERDARLRHALSKMKRELAQARKYIKTLEAALEKDTDGEEVVEEQMTPSKSTQCHWCKQEVDVIEAGVFIIHDCKRGCGRRRSIHNIAKEMG